MPTNKKIGSHGNEQGAVDHKHSWRANAAREISANEASQRHPAPERNHINTHDAAAQFVGAFSCTSEAMVEKTIIMLATVKKSRMSLSALVRNYGDVFGGVLGCRSESLLFDFGEESSQIFASEGPLKGRGGFLVPLLKG